MPQNWLICALKDRLIFALRYRLILLFKISKFMPQNWLILALKDRLILSIIKTGQSTWLENTA